MTVITRYPTTPTTASALPVLTWETGLSPNRRWLPARLPADSATLSTWTSQDGALGLPVIDAAKPLTVGTESGIRYALSSGVVAEGFNLTIADPSTVRTVVMIGRPNVGDTVVGTGRLLRFADSGGVNQGDADLVFVSGGATSLAAVRGKWHVYSVSLPAVGTVGGTGVFACDGNSTTFSYSDATWTASSLRIAAVPGSSSGRAFRILEIITSAESVDASTLTGLYAKAKAWYPDLDWDGAGGGS